MKNLRIIEDHSPYYITFTFDGIENIIDTFLSIVDKGEGLSRIGGFKINSNFDFVEVYNPDIEDYKNDCLAYYLDRKTLHKVISYLPWDSEIDFSNWAGRVFESKPGYKHIIHKDKLNFGLNFMIRIPNDKCLTSFYKTEDVEPLIDAARLDELKNIVGKQIWELDGRSPRITSGIDTDKLIPTHVFSGKQSEAILFNTDIYHNWDNSASDKSRLIGCIRPTKDDSTFDEIRLKLFGF